MDRQGYLPFLRTSKVDFPAHDAMNSHVEELRTREDRSTRRLHARTACWKHAWRQEW
jgi:hypothetical protein